MKVKSFLVNILIAAGFICVIMFFIDSSLKVPVMELSPDGKCLRVVDENGQTIPNGCKQARKGQLATDHRYVAW
jgi:hypothetical protein